MIPGEELNVTVIRMMTALQIVAVDVFWVFFILRKEFFLVRDLHWLKG